MRKGELVAFGSSWYFLQDSSTVKVTGCPGRAEKAPTAARAGWAHPFARCRMTGPASRRLSREPIVERATGFAAHAPSAGNGTTDLQGKGAGGAARHQNPDGPASARAIRKPWPDARVLLFSGLKIAPGVVLLGGHVHPRARQQAAGLPEFTAGSPRHRLEGRTPVRGCVIWDARQSGQVSSSPDVETGAESPWRQELEQA